MAYTGKPMYRCTGRLLHRLIYTSVVPFRKSSNDTITKDSNDYELEKVLFNEISKKNLGAVTNISDQFTIFNLTGSNIFEILSKGCPFDFNPVSFTNNKVAQTILNHIDVTIHKKNESNVDLYVRRSFSKHLWDWLKDSASLV